ncbi:hypothetical protein ACHAXR_012284 [Thalassiosira sp. AJA248-18]
MQPHATMVLDQTPNRKYHDKEEFVTGHSGTSAHEIFFLCLVIPTGLHLYFKLHSYRLVSRGHRGAKHGIVWEDVAIEFLTLMVPMLLVQTSLLPYAIGPPGLLAGMLALASLIPSKCNNNQTTASKPSTNSHTQSQNYQRRPPFLSIHRSCVYVLTTIAILAVDFPIFPRRFCKTEIGGYGWMDLGAASFIIIAGWTSALAAAGPLSNPSKATTFFSLVRKAIKKCTPLLLIGFIRLTTNKGLEYQEHVSEYGVHWNFFFTLCCVEGFMVAWKGLKRHLVDVTAKIPLDGILALLMMIPYQLFLSSGGGQDFVENGDRRCNESNVVLLPAWLVSDFPSLCDIFVANREGVLGVVGYFSLRLLSEDVARLCLLPTGDPKEQKNDNTMRKQHLLATTSILLWMAHLCLTVGFQIPNSRRSTNASFILWSLSHNTSLLCLIHYTMKRVPTSENENNHTMPQILDAVNRFGLAVFLSSNILTGLVNLTVDTLHSSNGKALFVLSIYLALVSGIAILLDIFFKKNKVD